MTLIDVAILLILIGLILGPLIAVYDTWKSDNERGDTTQHYNAINKAIADYYFEKREYPCPARPDLNPSDLNYGQEACGDPGLSFAGGTVMIGAVPFATLKIPTEMNLDGWSNKITYAVTTAQTVAPPLPTTPFPDGEIQIWGRLREKDYVCDMNFTLRTPAAHYILVSHGPSGRGAHTAGGVAREACPATGATADANNCINDAEFVRDECMGRTTAGSNFYDDMTDYKFSVPSRIWQNAEVVQNNIISHAEFTGINNSDPQATLHVRGNIKALQTGSNTICAENGSGCFTATMIGGMDPLMKCASNPGSTSSAMSGIGDARAKCQSGYTSFKIDCPNGQYIKRIGSNGELVCGN